MDKKTATKVQEAIKKVVKKAPAKKVVAKKTKSVSKPESKRLLVYANGASSFWLNDGQILNSLVALHDALSEMDKQLYNYHVCDDRHDFADWVEEVLCDNDCASDLRSAKNAKSAKTIVAKYLKSYEL